MKPSEQLAELGAPLPANLAEWGEEVRRRGAIFLDVLPQIVAVVQAAEEVAENGYFGDGTCYIPEEALGDLDEALRVSRLTSVR